jgi:hypothetical protein
MHKARPPRLQATSIDPKVSLAQLLMMVRNAEATFGEIRDILIRESRTVVITDPGKKLTSPIEIEVDDHQTAAPPPGAFLAVRGQAYVEEVPRGIMAYRYSR